MGSGSPGRHRRGRPGADGYGRSSRRQAADPAALVAQDPLARAGPRAVLRRAHPRGRAGQRLARRRRPRVRRAAARAAHRRAGHGRHGHDHGNHPAVTGRRLVMGMVLWGNLSWHPAAAAWREVAPTAPIPDRIEVLRQKKGAAVYRLVGAGPGGAPILARRSRLAKALVERTVYQRILSRLPITAPRYYAFRTASPGFAWVFLQEAW